jgi:hypothetical protein
MPAAQKNFLTDSLEKVRKHADMFSGPALPYEREVDTRYREEAVHNMRQGEKHFMWGEANKILTMAMSAVLMGGVTGTVVKLAVGSTLGMGLLAAGGVALAAAALGAAYISFKSNSKYGVNVIETNADLAARSHARELVPALSKTIGAEVKEAFKDAVREMREEQHGAMVQGAAHTKGTVEAAVGNTPEEHKTERVVQEAVLETPAKIINYHEASAKLPRALEKEHNGKITDAKEVTVNVSSR